MGQHDRGHADHRLDGADAVLAAQQVRLDAGPARQEVVFGAGALERLDHVDAGDRRAGQPPVDLHHVAVGDVAVPGREPHDDQVDGDEGGHRQRQPDVVGEHGDAVDGRPEQVDRVDGQPVRKQPRDRVVGRDAGSDVAQAPLAEELHRQADDVPDEPHRRDHRQLGRHAGQQGALKPDQRAVGESDRPEPDEQRPDPGVVAPDQDVVDEDAQQRRQRQAGNDHRQRRQDREGQRPPSVAETRAQAHEDVRRPAAALEAGARFEREADAAETLVELLERDPGRPRARIVDVGVPAPEPLQHDEVVEVPEQHHGEWQAEQLLPVHAEALGRQPVPAGRAHHGRGVGAVARDPAVHAQHLQRHPPAVVGEDHPEAGRAALDGLHLQHGRRAPAPGALQVGGELAFGTHGPAASRNHGRASAIGASLATRISTDASVPAVSAISSPRRDVQSKPLTDSGLAVSVTRPG